MIFLYRDVESTGTMGDVKIFAVPGAILLSSLDP